MRIIPLYVGKLVTKLVNSRLLYDPESNQPLSINSNCIHVGIPFYECDQAMRSFSTSGLCMILKQHSLRFLSSKCILGSYTCLNKLNTAVLICSSGFCTSLNVQT